MIKWLLDNFELILIPLTGIIAWFANGRFRFKKDLKDREIQLESNQSDIVSKNLDLYQRMLDDVEKRYENKIFNSDNEKKELNDLIKKLKTNVNNLEKELIKSENLNYELELRIKRFINEVINLKGKLEMYEKEN